MVGTKSAALLASRMSKERSADELRPRHKLANSPRAARQLDRVLLPKRYEFAVRLHKTLFDARCARGIADCFSDLLLALLAEPPDWKRACRTTGSNRFVFPDLV